MITKALKNFNLRQIADSGQCFRMVPCDPNRSQTAYRVISGRHFLIVEQTGDEVTFHCPNDEFAFWEHYFDLKTDYDTYIRAIDPMDDYLSRAAAFGSGIRILNQDLWEMIITFIISQQKTIPAIRALVEALSEKYGTRNKIPPTVSGYYYAFPSPEELNRASLDDLLALKLGYRAKYIKRTCEDVCSGKLDLDRLMKLNYADSMEVLLSCYGIGVKVANCICLFGLHHIGAFPVDTWIKKILLREYAPKSHCTGHVPETRLCEALIEENFSKYPGFAGVLQQYIFFYEREFSQKNTAGYERNQI
ncbi:DNA-3-methyladenine glycosylase 2 [Clostridium sp. AF12-19]|nr:MULTISPECIES: DNA glycosylase [unclassified Clostridium]RHS26181.1 DNA-3-methyladenine glycosylase 2 [Clostridium sp. AF12-28]RHS29754.1 DNA-3-methyladenine glycosylase 2 [Clostridium sp. AF12-19]